MKKVFISSITLLLIGCFSSVATAQDYDDDIYYNPSTSKTKAKTTNSFASSTFVAEYPAADTYTPIGSGVSMDVDAYNRRGIFANDSASIASRTETPQSFECTQQIERFYNPQVIVDSPDETVAQIYYATPATDIDIYVGSPYWGYSYYPYSYYSSPWYWGSPRSWWYYSSWAYNPWYRSSWYWGYYPSYYPGYYPNYYPGYYPPHRPAYRPSGPSRPGGNYRPSGYHGKGTNNYRPSNRPNDYRPGGNTSGPNYRPGRGTNRSNSSSGYRPGNNSNKDNNSYRPSSNSTNKSSNSYRPSSNSSNRSESTPSYRSGGSRSSGGGGFHGGGSTRGGGGGGRGRR